MKLCPACKQEKSFECFYQSKHTRSGWSCYCKVCTQAKNRVCAKKNPEPGRAAKRRWAKNNPDKVRAIANSWNARHPERHRAHFRRWYAANSEYCVERGIAWREANRELSRDLSRDWARRNPDAVRENCRRRRARLSRAETTLTAKQWRQRVTEFDRCCAYCLSRLEVPTQDHFYPLSRGGSHSQENVVPACGSCNPAKGNRLVFEWVPRGLGVCPPAG
jgi:hypothetical protein